MFSLEKWQSLNICGADLVLNFINSVPIEKGNYLLLTEKLILQLPLYGYKRLAKNDISEGAKILSNLLSNFYDNVKYKKELHKAFAHAHCQLKDCAKLRLPKIISKKHLFKPRKLLDVLSIRRIAKRSEKAGMTNNFVVAEYSENFTTNIGDSIQQIAIIRALRSLFADIPITLVERDAWCKYRGGGLSIMQGWFGYRESFPSKDTLPLWIGTHLTNKMRDFLKRVADANHNLFGHIGFGARDQKTLRFAQTIDSKAYLSRCYTLTLPRRTVEPNDGKAFLVNIPVEWEEYIPSELLDGAIRITHGVRGVSIASDRAECAHDLLERYKNEARLVITCKVHSASPCTAMGIPVVAITESLDSKERISFLEDLITINSQDDLKNHRIKWNPIAPDMEELKQLMLENLHLSVLAAQGNNVDRDELDHIRRQIAEYSIRKSF